MAVGVHVHVHVHMHVHVHVHVYVHVHVHAVHMYMRHVRMCMRMCVRTCCAIATMSCTYIYACVCLGAGPPLCWCDRLGAHTS